MARIEPLTIETAGADTKPILENIKKQVGMVPNIYATMAHSPAVIQSVLDFKGALGKTSLSAAFKEQVALAVAGANQCGYCASAHTAVGKGMGLSSEVLERSLRAEAEDAKEQAGLAFARQVVEARGFVSDEQLQAVRDAGYTDGEVMELVAVVVFNIFTNYINHVVETEVDFPAVALDPALSV
ncbi:MAG: carboxymuconolactone decarboxylase family protein [Phycisphaerae bacterium]